MTISRNLSILAEGASAFGVLAATNGSAGVISLPSGTVTTNRLDVGFLWNVAASSWRCVASA